MKILISIFIFIAVSFQSKSQNFQSEEEFTLKSKEIAIILFQSYYKDYSNINDLTPEEESGYHQFEMEILQNDTATIEDLLTFFNSSSGWKTGYGQKQFNPFYQEYRKGIDQRDWSIQNLIDNLNLPIATTPPDSSSWLKTKDSLTNIYRSETIEIVEDEKGVSQPEILVEDNVNEDSILNNILIYAAIFICGIIATIVFLQIRLNQIVESANRESPYFLIEEVKHQIHQRKKLSKDHESTKESWHTNKLYLEKEISELKDVITELQNKSVTREETYPEIPSNISNLDIDYRLDTPEINEPLKNVMYFKIPNSEGSFHIQHGTSSKEPMSHFKIESDVDATEGKLYFISGSMDERAINNFQTSLKPVCEIDNVSIYENAHHIEFIEPGIVTLEESKWVISEENRVKIKFVE